MRDGAAQIEILRQRGLRTRPEQEKEAEQDLQVPLHLLEPPNRRITAVPGRRSASSLNGRISKAQICLLNRACGFSTRLSARGAGKPSGRDRLSVYLSTELVTIVVAISVIVVVAFPFFMPRGVAMVTIILPRMVMAISVAVAMLRPAPVAFSIALALWAVLIVRDDPACLCIRRLHVMTSHPAVVVPLGRPESGHPHKG